MDFMHIPIARYVSSISCFKNRIICLTVFFHSDGGWTAIRKHQFDQFNTTHDRIAQFCRLAFLKQNAMNFGRGVGTLTGTDIKTCDFFV
ncbi:hypothetical protein GLUCORHAEAF1_14530 [Komagataeibacter rhaeticus AF1]|nr:hypothetical protein GLUCORHAEAF1_14530 [Komagataeibacter rhaeticus AF1]